MAQSDDAWSEVGDQFRKLGLTFKHLYETRDDGHRGEPPSDDEVKDALRTLGESVSHAFAAVGDAFKDPDVKEETRQAAGLFFDALGATLSGVGDDISGRTKTEDSSAESPEDPPEQNRP